MEKLKRSRIFQIASGMSEEELKASFVPDRKTIRERKKSAAITQQQEEEEEENEEN